MTAMLQSERWEVGLLALGVRWLEKGDHLKLCLWVERIGEDLSKTRPQNRSQVPCTAITND
jgi:hypothetical protein